MTKNQILLSNIIITISIVFAFFYLTQKGIIFSNSSSFTEGSIDTIYIEKSDEKENITEAIYNSRNTIITNMINPNPNVTYWLMLDRKSKLNILNRRDCNEN